MMSQLIIALLTLGGGALVMYALGARTRERDVDRRIGLIMPGAMGRRAPAKDRPSAAATRGRRVADGIRRMFAFHMRRSWGTSSGPAILILAGLVAALTLWLLTRLALHASPHIALAVALAGFYVVPRLMLIREQRSADAHFAALLPDAIDMVVRIVRAGLPVGAAIRTVGREADAPISGVFAEVADQNEIGLALDEALGRSSTAIGNPDFRFFAVAVALQQSTGGNLAVTLETLSQIIRKRRAVRLKAKAATAEVRVSGLILGAIPFVVTGALLLVAPSYLDPLFVDRRGNLILAAAILLLAMAGLTMRTMMRNALNV